MTITKYLCPDGQASNYADACDEVLGGITFQATGPDDYDASDETGDNGRVAFEGLIAGDYVVTEYPPDDPHVAVYVVSCTEDGAPFDFAYDDSTGLRINLELGVDEQVRCNWYNVPPKPGPSGSITVEKFLCQGNKDNDYDWENDCDVYGAGADFDLLNEDGDVITSGTTNDNGELTFTGLADGAYGLDETSADWCHAEADIVDAKGNVVVEDGGDTARLHLQLQRETGEHPAKHRHRFDRGGRPRRERRRGTGRRLRRAADRPGAARSPDGGCEGAAVGVTLTPCPLSRAPGEGVFRYWGGRSAGLA